MPPVITGTSKFHGGNTLNLYKCIFNYARKLLAQRDILEIFPCVQKEGKVGGKHLEGHQGEKQSAHYHTSMDYQIAVFITQQQYHQFRTF